MSYGMGNGQQVIVLREGTERSKNRDAQTNNIAAARAVADAVRSTLGPKGMDKMLVDSMGDVVITNDGVTILKEIDVQHPAAKMVVEIAKTQDSECGDGTTSSVIIAGELLKKAEALIESNIHPTIIANGYKMAAAEALKVLDTIAVPVTADDVEMLTRVAMTAMTGKSVGGQRDFLADLSVVAIKAIAEKNSDGKWTVDVDNIKVEKKTGGSIADTEIINGSNPLVLSSTRSVTCSFQPVNKHSHSSRRGLRLQGKRKQAGRAREIPLPQSVLRMLGECGMKHTIYKFVTAQPCRNLQRRRLVLAQAHAERLKTAQPLITILARSERLRRPIVVVEFRRLRLVDRHCSEQERRVSSDVLRSSMDGNVRPQRERVQIKRRCPGIVDDGQYPARPSDFRDGADVLDLRVFDPGDSRSMSRVFGRRYSSIPAPTVDGTNPTSMPNFARMPVANFRAGP